MAQEDYGAGTAANRSKEELIEAARGKEAKAAVSKVARDQDLRNSTFVNQKPMHALNIN